MSSPIVMSSIIAVIDPITGRLILQPFGGGTKIEIQAVGDSLVITHPDNVVNTPCYANGYNGYTFWKK